MTTIAYSRRENKIAIDSRTTSDGLIVTDAKKKWLVGNDGCVYFIAGANCDAQEMLDRYEAGKKNQGTYLGCNLVRATSPPAIIGIEDGVLFTEVLDEDFRCVGSGELLALASLDHGKTVRQSVAYAMTRDIYTGGKISVYDLSRSKFQSFPI